MGTTKYLINCMENVENVDAKSYFRQYHLRIVKKILLMDYKIRLWFPNDIIINCAERIVDEQISQLEKIEIPIQFLKLLDSNLKKKEQIKLLKGVSITPNQLGSLFLEAGKHEYGFSHYMIDIPQKKYSESKLPKLVHIVSNNEIKHIGETQLTDGQLKEFVESSNFVVARFLDNGKHWHCFLQTRKSIMGKESGFHGSQCHLHYISDRFGRYREEIVNDIKNGSYMTTPVHILLKDYEC